MKNFPAALIILVLALFSAAETFAADNSLPQRPKISVSEPSFHFGKIRQGEVVSHDFVVKNIGTAELNLLRVNPGCGCTATNISKRKLSPGEESRIKVDFNSAGFLGKKVRNISVETNDPKMPVVVLTMQGVIEAEVTVKPRALTFGEIQRGKVAQREFTLNIAEGAKTKISSVTAKSQYITVSKVREKGSELVYSVAIKNDAKIGSLRGMILISLNDKNRTSLTLPVFASIVDKTG